MENENGNRSSHYALSTFYFPLMLPIERFAGHLNDR
jgi:hypothetical protein